MRLAWKLTLVLGLGICAVQGVYAWSRVQRESALFETDMRRDHRVLAKAVSVTAAKVWSSDGEAQALELIDDANVRHSQVLIEWVSPTGRLADGNPVAGSLRDALREGRERQWIEDGSDGERYLHSFAPVAVDGAIIGGVHLSETMAPEREYVRATLFKVGTATATTVAVTAAMTLALGFLFVGRPVRQLVGMARRVGEGDLSGRLAVRHRDEIGLLGGELNRMCDRLAEAREQVAAETASRLAAVDQLRHADRLATAGKLVSGIAHELGTPLNVAGMRAKAIVAGEVSGKAVAENAQVVVEQVDRITHIIRQLLDFARRRGPQKAPTDPGHLVRQTFSLLAPMARRRGVVLSCTGDDAPQRVEIDPGQVQQALTNLVMNAIQSMPADGEVTVAIDRVHAQPPADHGGPAADYLRIDVRDRGTGIPAAILPRIFDPFFTTKDVGEGTGLGLSVSYGIAREHGGWIAVDTAEGQGSCFSLFLPCNTATEAA